MRSQIKQSLHEQYPKSIPLIESPHEDETISERIDYLEQFLKQFVCDVDYMEDIKGGEEEDIEEADPEQGIGDEEENHGNGEEKNE